MGSSYLASPLLLIINTLFDLYVLLVLGRFLLQALRANFYNPVSQFVVRATTPPLRPLRRIIPGLAGQDMAALVLALLLLMIKYYLVRALGLEILQISSFIVNVIAPIGSMNLLALIIVAIAEILVTFINIFLFAIFIQVILSWVNPGAYNPVIGLVISISNPVMKPIQRFIPPMGGLDLSPLFASLALMVLKMLLIPPFIEFARLL